MTLLTATDMKLTAVKSCGKAGKPKKALSRSAKRAFHANSSAPVCVNRTNVPLSCSTSQLRAIARLRPVLYSAGVAFSVNRSGPLIFSI